MYLCGPLPVNIHLICIFRLQHFLSKHFCLSLLLFFFLVCAACHWEDSRFLLPTLSRFLLHLFSLFVFWHCHTYKFMLSRKYTTFQGFGRGIGGSSLVATLVFLFLRACVCVDSNSSKRICKVMHICNIGSSIDSFSNIFQVHWKNLQRSFSIYTTTNQAKFACVCESVFSTFCSRKNIWNFYGKHLKKYTGVCCKSTNREVGCGGKHAHRYGFRVEWFTDKFADEEHAHHGKMYEKNKCVRKKKFGKLPVFAIYRLADASSFPPPKFYCVQFKSTKAARPHERKKKPTNKLKT